MVIIFFGSSQYSVPVAKSLLRSGFKLIFITVPDRPVGRKKQLTPNPLAQFAQDNRLPTFKLDSLRQDKVPVGLIDKITQASLGISCVYGKIIPSWLIDRLEKGILNIHPSLLPKYRGASPAVGMIINQEKVGGVTIIKMDEKIDHGPVVAQIEEKIRRHDTAQSLYKRFFALAAKIIPEVTNAYLNHNLPIKPQNHRQASFTSRLTRNDGGLEKDILQKGQREEDVSFLELPPIFQKTITNPQKKYPAAQAIFNLYRALYPWPGLWTKVNIRGVKKRLKIISLAVKAKKLKLLQVQIEGKKPINFEEFIKTYPEAFK